MVADVLVEANEIGIEGEFVDDAKYLMKSRGGPEAAKDLQARLTERLQLAIESRRLGQLREAIQYGKDHGAPMIEIFKAEKVLSEEQEFLQAIHADIDAILKEHPIDFAPGKDNFCQQDRTAINKVGLLLGTLPENMSFAIHVHHACSPPHGKNFRCCADLGRAKCERDSFRCCADHRGLSGNRARYLKLALCSASKRTNIIAKGWGCQHSKIGSKKLVRIVPTQLDD